MVISRPFVFIAQKNGKILVNTKGTSDLTLTRVEYGHRSNCFGNTYFVNSSAISPTINVMFGFQYQVELLFYRYKKLKDEYEKTQRKTARTKAIYADKIGRLKSLASSIIDRHKRHMESVNLPANGLVILPDGRIYEYLVNEVVYEEREGFQVIDVKQMRSVLPVTIGSYWSVCENFTLSENINAILNISSTCEEALEVLIRTNHVKDGEWMEPITFLNSIGFQKICDEKRSQFNAALDDILTFKIGENK